MGVYMWLALLTIFQIIDGVTTYVVIENGIAKEFNPIMLQYMDWFGVAGGLIILKLIVMILGYFLIIKYWSKVVIRLTCRIITFFYFVIASLNTFALLFIGAT